MKRIVTVILALTMLLSTNAFAFTFKEVPAEEIFSPEIIEQEKVSDWAKDEIELARAAGLITEHTGDYMTHDITRFQFAELVVNMVEKATGKTITAAPDTTFTDTKEIAVLKANAAGIVTGVGDNLFDPDKTTNREQIAAMVYRAITYIEKETGKAFTTKNADLAKFTDKASVSTWAVEGVGVLANNGIMKGTSDTTLSPGNTCPVEQSILLVYRVFNLAKTAIETPTAPNEMYEKYPMIPDYGKAAGIPLISEQDEDSGYVYKYNYFKQQSVDYMRLLDEYGFKWVSNSEVALIFRNVKHKDMVISITSSSLSYTAPLRSEPLTLNC